MGYGFGVVLIGVGLVMVYALEIDIPGVGDETLGWILVAAGAALIVITAVQMNSRRGSATSERTTHADGSQTRRERRTD